MEIDGGSQIIYTGRMVIPNWKWSVLKSQFIECVNCVKIKTVSIEKCLVSFIYTESRLIKYSYCYTEKRQVDLVHRNIDWQVLS